MHNALIPAAHILLLREDRDVLLIRRQNTGFADGQYGLPAGHVDPGELPLAAAVREAMEEVGVEIEATDMHAAHVMTSPTRVSFFFIARQWRGEPRNCEPQKCDDVRWFALDALPANMVAYTRLAVERIRAGLTYSERIA